MFERINSMKSEKNKSIAFDRILLDYKQHEINRINDELKTIIASFALAAKIATG